MEQTILPDASNWDQNPVMIIMMMVRMTIMRMFTLSGLSGSVAPPTTTCYPLTHSGLGSLSFSNESQGDGDDGIKVMMQGSITLIKLPQNYILLIFKIICCCLR